MVASFRKIDYSLRPAKHAERRMLCEIFRNLRPFQPVEDYVYLGFGSLWFSDFIMFHRMLGIREMISIERSSGAKERFDANKPFNAITMDYRESSEALPDREWNRRHFVWLDYDDPLSPDMLLDTKIVANNAKSGSVFAISIQCMEAPEIEQAKRAEDGSEAITWFQTNFGNERVPDSVTEFDLIGWAYGELSRKMVISEIEAALSVRNISAENGEVIKFTPICDIEYEDGAKMSTLVGIFHAANEDSAIEECHFDKLDFLPDGVKSIRIDVPKLTIREIRFLEQLLPDLKAKKLKKTKGASIPSSEVEAFAKYYRYLPNFAVLES